MRMLSVDIRLFHEEVKVIYNLTHLSTRVKSARSCHHVHINTSLKHRLILVANLGLILGTSHELMVTFPW